MSTTSSHAIPARMGSSPTSLMPIVLAMVLEAGAPTSTEVLPPAAKGIRDLGRCSRVATWRPALCVMVVPRPSPLVMRCILVTLIVVAEATPMATAAWHRRGCWHNNVVFEA